MGTSSRESSSCPVVPGDLEEGSSYTEGGSLASYEAPSQVQDRSDAREIPSRPINASSGSPPGSVSSSDHEWPLRLHGAHAGETKRTCAVCLVRREGLVRGF